MTQTLNQDEQFFLSMFERQAAKRNLKNYIFDIDSGGNFLTCCIFKKNMHIGTMKVFIVNLRNARLNKKDAEFLENCTGNHLQKEIDAIPMLDYIRFMKAKP